MQNKIQFKHNAVNEYTAINVRKPIKPAKIACILHSNKITRAHSRYRQTLPTFTQLVSVTMSERHRSKTPYTGSDMPSACVCVCVYRLTGVDIPSIRSADVSHYDPLRSNRSRPASLHGRRHHRFPAAGAAAAATGPAGLRGNANAVGGGGRRWPCLLRTGCQRDASAGCPVAKIHLQDAR